MLELLTLSINSYSYNSTNPKRIVEDVLALQKMERKNGIQSRDLKPKEILKYFRWMISWNNSIQKLLDSYHDPVEDYTTSIQFREFGIFQLNYSLKTNIPNSTELIDYTYRVKLADIDFDISTGLIDLTFKFVENTKNDFTLENLLRYRDILGKFVKYMKLDHSKYQIDKLPALTQYKELVRMLRYRNDFRSHPDCLSAFIDSFKSFKINLVDTNGINHIISYGSGISIFKNEKIIRNNTTMLKLNISNFTIMDAIECGEILQNYNDNINETKENILLDIDTEFEQIKI